MKFIRFFVNQAPAQERHTYKEYVSEQFLKGTSADNNDKKNNGNAFRKLKDQGSDFIHSFYQLYYYATCSKQ